VVPEKERWSSFLPFWTEEARAKGYDLPLPLGISMNYFFLRRDIEVDRIEVGRGNNPLRDVTDFVQVGANSDVHAFLARLDAFVLPFLNVYLLGGWIENTSEVDVDVTLDTPGPGPGITFRVNDADTLDGPTYGGGGMLFGGYRAWFLQVDANYTITDLGHFDSDFKALVASGRTGWHGRLWNRPVRVWVGATYWDTARQVNGSVVLPTGERVRFSVEQGPKNPWNMNFGTNVQVIGPVDFTIDFGTNYDDVFSIATAFAYRF